MPVPLVISHAWKILLLLAAGFLLWCAAFRIQRVNHLSGLGPQGAVIDATSPTGYTGGRRWLIVPEHNVHAYQWIEDTQRMIARGEWRIREVDYDNAPLGRGTYSPSPYRWWLGFVAWGDHLLFDHPIGLSVERAALVANPLLHLLLLLVSTLVAARWFGTAAAAFLAIGLATLFPLAGAFLPGVADSQGLGLALALWSVLPLVRFTDNEAAADAARSRRQSQDERSFLLAGIAGGLGLWIGVAQQALVILGIVLGGIATAWLRCEAKLPAHAPERRWRLWALSGAVTSLAAYLLEYFPTHLDWRPEVNHPIYGLAWLGLGELVAQIASRPDAGTSFWNRKRAVLLVLAFAAFAVLPVAFWITGQYLGADPLATRLTNLPGGATAATFGAWLRRDGPDGVLFLTCLPLAATIPVGILIARRSLATDQRAALLLGLGPVLTTLVFAWFHLREWSLVDVLVLAVATAAVGVGSRPVASPAFRWCSLVGAVLVALGGLIRLWPPIGQQSKGELTRLEAISLIERDAAHWIADRTGADGAVILAPPYSSVSLAYYGGLRGLGSPTWENQEGVAATIQILRSLRGEVALDRLSQRGVTHIVLPSWDNDLDEFLQWSMPRPEASLLAAIHRSALPPWARPLAYSPPTIPGFENQSITILKVTDEDEQWLALARRAEYFLEMQQLEGAEAASNALKAYPGNLGALAVRAAVEKARGNEAEFATIFNALRSQLGSNPASSLPWDRRVSLAIILALGGEADFAREQARRCLNDINETRIRDLNTGTLYRLLVLVRAYGLQFPTPTLHDHALHLLPADLRARF